MDKRYQVFISSTFNDLEDERKLLMQILLRKGCFPAGMELFPAINEEQFEYIKQVIDDTDYYVIILGGMYGTIAPDGKSYTEKEYDYAVEKNKVIIVLEKENPQVRESDDDRVVMFANFHKKIIEKGLYNSWDTMQDLSSKFTASLDNAISEFPKQGWIRCNADKCDARLQCVDMSSKIASLDIEKVRTIHIMGSGTLSYIPMVKNLLKKNKNKKGMVNVFIYFRLGDDVQRLNNIKNQYDKYWDSIKNEYPKIKYSFIGVKDFKMSFRGIVVNQKVGTVGFYYRENSATYGTLDDSIYVDKQTDIGRDILRYFLKCFDEQPIYSTMKECVENSN